MGLTRKRQRELTRLKGHAEDVWGDQKDVLGHASKLVREARRQAANYAREEVSPRVRDTLDHSVLPVVASSVAATRGAVTATRGKITDEFVPAVSSAFGSARGVMDSAKEERLREALKLVALASDTLGKRVSETSSRITAAGAGISERAVQLSKEAAKVSAKAAKINAKARPVVTPGPGRYILASVIVVAIAGIAYAIWQTLRADDDLWIDEDDVPYQEHSTPADDTV